MSILQVDGLSTDPWEWGVIVEIYFVSIDAWAQLAILLTCEPGVVVVKLLGQVVLWVELPVKRRLCLIFVSGVGLPDIHEYSAG